MVTFAFSPSWFLGIDAIFELVTVLVTLLIAVYSYKLYKFTKERGYRFFSYAFLLIGISYVINILMNISVYHPVIKVAQVGIFTIITKTFERVEIFYAVGFFVLRFLLLLGLVTLLLVLHKKKDKKYSFLLLYLAFVSALIGNYIFHIFYITSSLLLLFIFVYYYNNYLRYRSRNSLCVAISFLLIFVSQIVFILLTVHPVLYVVGESIQLLGYLLLLFIFISILKK